MDILSAIIGLIVGAVIGYLLAKVISKSSGKENLKALEEQSLQLESDKRVLEDRIEKSLEVFKDQKTELEHEREKNVRLNALLSEEKANQTHLQEKLDTQKEEIEQLREKFQKDFENIANKLLKQNSAEFAESNQKRLGEILKPFREKITDFEKKVTDVYDKEAKDRHHLKGEIKQLVELNQKISEEAKNLTKALKGDTKKQGNWGEIVLERVLERSGLVKGQEYETQYSTENESGKRIQPDVIVFLPDEKHIIIDSKVSLIDYEHYVTAEEESKKEVALKKHLNSIRTHIKGLYEKSYQTSKDLTSPDFVLLFIPVESSFSIAIQADPELFNFAWERKIVLVSPTTLLATLRTIASIWKQEKQTKNALEIARQSGALYDKFVGFISDMEKIDRGLNSSKKAYDDAINKLHRGQGNLVRRAENIRKLGAKASKKMPGKFIDDAPGDLPEESQE